MSAPQALVIHHSSFHVIGGAENATRHWVDELRRAGIAVTVWTYAALPSWTPERLRRLLFPYLVAWRLVVRRQRHGFTFIDASTGDTWLFCLIARRRPHVVVRSHGLEPLAERAIRRVAAASSVKLGFWRDVYYRWWMPWEVRQSLRRADLVRVLNRAEQEYCTCELGLDPGRVMIGQNGRQPAPLPDPQPNSQRIASIGRWEPTKGSHDIAAVMTTVMRSRRDVQLSLLGVGRPADTVLASFPIDLRDRIEVVERYRPDEVFELLAGNGIYLSMTYTEGSSIALLEAMAAGLVPVVSAAGAAPDLLAGAGCGGLFEPGETAKCLETVLDLVDDPARVAAMSTQAQRLVAGMIWQTITQTDLVEFAERLRLPELAPPPRSIQAEPASSTARGFLAHGARRPTALMVHRNADDW